MPEYGIDSIDADHKVRIKEPLHGLTIMRTEYPTMYGTRNYVPGLMMAETTVQSAKDAFLLCSPSE